MPGVSPDSASTSPGKSVPLSGKLINIGGICSGERSMRSQPEIRNNFERVKTAGSTDPAAGIRIVKVTGDDGMGLHEAGLGPHSRITAPYPQAGSENYQKINGEGMFHSGVPSSSKRVVWNRSVCVKGGDCFTVREGEVHELKNTGSPPLLVTIICPAAQIGHDSFIVKGAIPQWRGWDFYAALPF